MQEDKPLTSRFESFEAAPSDAVWQNIESQLGQKKKRRLVFWWTSVLAASVIFGLFLLPYFSSDSEPTTSKEIIRLNQNKSNETKTDAALEEQTIAKRKKSSLNSAGEKYLNNIKTQSFVSPFGEKLTIQSKKKVKIEEPFLTPELVPVDTPTPIAEIIKAELITDDSTINLVDNDNNSNTLVQPEIELPDPQVINKRWEIGLFVGAGRGNKIIDFQPLPSPSINPADQNNLEATSLSGNTNYEQPVIPIQVQAIIARDLGKKLRLTTGLGFGLYRKNIRLFQEDELIKLTPLAQIHIPVLMDFKIIEKKKWEWTTGPGVLLGYRFNKLNNDNKHQLTTNLQWQTALRYQLKKDWSLSVQPHYRYQLGDNSPAKTVFYKNHFWGVNVGLIRKF